ncbi:MAG: hypothetical protein QM770_05560 [Tepidisphaeraceae bacterium]
MFIRLCRIPSLPLEAGGRRERGGVGLAQQSIVDRRGVIEVALRDVQLRELHPFYAGEVDAVAFQQANCLADQVGV